MGMKNDIKRYVEECPICQQNKYQALSPSGFLQPLPILHQIWDDLTMDFIEGLSNSNGFDAILIVIDRLSMPIFRHLSILSRLIQLLLCLSRTLFDFKACPGLLSQIEIRCSLAFLD